MRFWLSFALLLLASSTLDAQSKHVVPFGFKGNYLGMPLSDFKSANATDTVVINTGHPDKFGQPDKSKNKEFKTPLCTDAMRGFPGDQGQLADGEVLCNISPGRANSNGLVVAGSIVDSVLYRFYKGRLFEIDISFPAFRFGLIAAAFAEKYGVPSETSDVPYQNGFGASWTGQIVRWKSDGQSISIEEGPANGPGQTASTVPAEVIFRDGTNSPPDHSDPPVDF